MMILANIAFRNLLAKGEKIYFVAHIHPFTIYPILFRAMVFGIAIPLGFYLLMPPLFWVWASWIAGGVLLFIYRIMQWYLDGWIVTNLGIIDQDWVDFFNKTVSRIDYANIQGISSEVNGFWPTILGYGNIQIEHTTGANIVLKDVIKPRKVEGKVLNYQQTFQSEQTMSDHNKLKELLTSLVRSAK